MKQYFGRFDYQTMEFSPPEIRETEHVGKCLVDGKEIKWAWFADTAAGILKTYDVSGSGPLVVQKQDGSAWTPSDFPGREVYCPIDGVISETLRGHVEILGPERGLAQL